MNTIPHGHGYGDGSGYGNVYGDGYGGINENERIDRGPGDQ